MKNIRSITKKNLSGLSQSLLKLLPIFILTLAITSCSSIKVAADYDKEANFANYKTFAFFKTGIDKAEISDIDKRRILRAIENELLAQGYMKSENPDLLVSIFTKSQQRVDIYNNHWGMGAWGWGGFGPWGMGGLGGWGMNQQPMVSTRSEGTLFIDLIDAREKELVWQGMGTGYLPRNIEKKDERITEFVAKVMKKFPPEIKK